jgi:hypothetical protein
MSSEGSGYETSAGLQGHISKRDQFWDQFLGPHSGVSLSSLSSSGGHAGTKLGPSLVRSGEQGSCLEEGPVLGPISGGRFWGLFPNREEPRQYVTDGTSGGSRSSAPTCQKIHRTGLKWGHQITEPD